jgi:predicted transcriptional regulator
MKDKRNKTSALFLRIGEVNKQKIEKLAAENMESMSAWIRQAIRERLKREGA